MGYGLMYVNKNNKLLLICIITEIIIFITYKLLENIGHSRELIFRSWIENTYMFSNFFLVIAIIVLFWWFLILKTDLKIKNNKLKVLLQTLFAVIFGVAIVLICLYGMFACSYSYKTEHLIYKENQNVIARVEPEGFHHTVVNFYIPVNIFFMKESDIESEMYDGSYDKYEQKGY
ncbi:hypothetical protein [Tepidibacter hydrothermalis]|uniref:DUF5673 domain-containing protein n=1 Tax=Tepidibacter hydrothermalis TaxID=3036126 RepID=A0ABY8EFL4_9FIRM|nr:hypothetical protein [Tepidibacter hydrothermalis]WFD09630.1 hypothetical protein P4S50_14730 [Tepidibacter hydrothermalis]